MKCDIERDLVRFLAGHKTDTGLENKLSKLVGKLKHDKPNVEFDFVFPSFERIEVWRKCSGVVDLTMPGLEQLSGETITEVNGNFKITKVKCEKGMVSVQIDRKALIETVLKNILQRGCRPFVDPYHLVLDCEKTRLEGATSLSMEKCSRVCKVMENLSKLDSEYPPKIFLVGCSDVADLKSCEELDGDVFVSVGAVINPDTKKKDTERSFDQVYDEIFQEKLEVSRDRVNEGMSEEQFDEQVRCLANAHVQFQFLQSSLAQPCTLRSDGGLEDMSSFILYNVARIFHIFRAFSEGQKYPNLPNLEEIDLGENLVEQEEFELVFDHLSEYELLLDSIVYDLIVMGQSKIHLLIRFLAGLSHSFSRYYNRFKILKDVDRPEKMFARLYLIKAVKSVLVHGLSILDIKAICNM